MTDDQPRVADLEREIQLFARHHVSVQQSRPGQHLERSAYLLLTRLESEESMSLRDLAEAFRLDVSTINRQIAPLLKRGLVERFTDPDGGTARRLRPTRDGLDQLAADRERSREGVAMVVADWPQDRITAFTELLTRFNTGIEGLEGNPWPRRQQD